MKIKFNLLLALLSLGCTQNFFGMINNNGSNGGPNQPPRRLFRDVFTEPQTLKATQEEIVSKSTIPLLFNTFDNSVPCWAEITKTTVKTYKKLMPSNANSSSPAPSDFTSNTLINKLFCYIPNLPQNYMAVAYQRFLQLDPNTAAQNQQG